MQPYGPYHNKHVLSLITTRFSETFYNFSCFCRKGLFLGYSITVRFAPDWKNVRLSYCSKKDGKAQQDVSGVEWINVACSQGGGEYPTYNKRKEG